MQPYHWPESKAGGHSNLSRSYFGGGTNIKLWRESS